MGRRATKAVCLVLAALAVLACPQIAAAKAANTETAPVRPPTYMPSGSSSLAPTFPAYFWPVDSSANVAWDSAGIPMYTYDGVPEYNPVTIEQMALFNYNQWKAYGSSSAKALFFKLADWLVDDQTSDGLWLYNFAFLNQPVPWWSGMAQGVGLSVLVRAYSQTLKPAYKLAATSALATFTRPISKRGITSSDNGTWYEEYLPPDHLHVLNGMIFAMMGLLEYSSEFHDSLSSSLWSTGVTTLANNLRRFDSGSWSYYDCDELKASIVYHKLHIALLGTMYSLTGMHTFNDYRARFQAYLDKE
jgi:heparosan-N-sulfate-glucuronate 5-epimerase